MSHALGWQERLDAAGVAPSPLTTRGRRRRRRRRDVAGAETTAVAFTWANRQPGTPGFARWAAQLGERIAAEGMAGAARDIDKLVTVARRFGVVPVAVEVLTDPTAPEPARNRAFAKVVAALVVSPPTVGSR
jgi:hypothetical protein